jgi:hypothetical protein
MKRAGHYFCFVLFVFLASCSTGPEDSIQIVSHTFDFSESQYDWTHGFSDFPSSPDDSAFYELKFCYANLDTGAHALMLSGNNHSDDLFMFIKKKLTGFEPNRTYTVTFEVELASDATEGSLGAGGSPGESVFLKVGATGIEPKSVIDNNFHVMNIDKGAQAESGEDMLTVGDIATPQNSTGYTIINRSNSTANYSHPFVAVSNSKGELWLIVGTDSGFEGVTTVYYTSISAVFSTAQ